MIRPSMFRLPHRSPARTHPAAGPCALHARAAAVHGFTLIELMIVIAIVAILAAVAYPSYVAFVVRGFRSEGQQWLQDFAQRQEQFFNDRRVYAAALGNNAGELPMVFPEAGTATDERYNPPVITLLPGPPPGFVACLQPLAGGPIANSGDGGLCIDSTGLRWRDVDTNGTFNAGTDRLWTD